MRKLTIMWILIPAFMCLLKNNSAGQEFFKPEEFLESLASRNKCPRISSIGSGEVQFDQNFDWKEYQRGLRILKELPRRSEQIWKTLPERLEDNRYVTTVATSSGAKLNVSLSEACKIFVRGTLTQPYLEVAPKTVNQKVVAANLVPEFMESTIATKQWLLDRKDTPIYKLQIELCEWAKSELNSRPFKRLNPSDTSTWKDSIDQVIGRLTKEESLQRTTVFSMFEDLMPEPSK